jgi:hypothetical protein
MMLVNPSAGAGAKEPIAAIAGGASAFARMRLRLLHALLTPGGLIGATEAAKIRGWARLLNWRAAATRQERMDLIRRAVWTPVRAWREAYPAVAMFGSEVHSVAGISPARQRWQLWWLATRHGMNAMSYLDYQLYRPERRPHAAAYLQEEEFYTVGRWLNRVLPRDDQYPIADKRGFFRWCCAHGLAVVPTLLEYCEGTLVASSDAAGRMDVLPRCDLFSKPSDDSGGNGTERWRYSPNNGERDRWTGRDSVARSEEELRAVFAQMSSALRPKPGKPSSRLLIQPCIRNHRDLLALTPGGLCTVRVVTYRTPGERARVLLAAYKMPTGDSPADNFHTGGIVAPVDIDTGMLGPAIRRAGRVLVPVDRHPDTGAVIEGHVLPWWPETMALATQALDAAHQRPTIGWDIAITDDGPVLIEGNSMSNPDIAQAPSGIPLSNTPFPAAVCAHVERALWSNGG